ncbi:MAG: LysR family transcriptional regulator [Sebaldella sp.]|nr:LysR family transcriptional regulator [Sebaldella sp.]
MYNQQLETFINVVEAGSFSKAANKAYITPTAIIKQINLLENHLDLTLFIRTHRGVILTESGRSLYQDAKYIIQYSKDSINRAKKAIQKIEHIIRIGTSPITPGEFLVELWPKIQEYCPNTKIQFITFENTPENAREILENLGKNIDLVAGIFDYDYLKLRKCEGLELSMIPIRCAVSINHKIASKKKLAIDDLFGENLMLIQRGWNIYVDMLRDDILKNYPQINIIDFSFYNLDVFNQCENNNSILMSVDTWENAHPLLKVLPVEWDHNIPFGLIHAPKTSKVVQLFLEAVKKTMKI